MSIYRVTVSRYSRTYVDIDASSAEEAEELYWTKPTSEWQEIEDEITDVKIEEME